jgi:hypothetical protein
MGNTRAASTHGGSAANNSAAVAAYIIRCITQRTCKAGESGERFDPFKHLPTRALELRAPDCCTRLEDTLAVTALYRMLVRRIFLNPWLNADLTAVSRAIIVENKWRAQRYGIHGTFVDEARPREVPFAQLA